MTSDDKLRWFIIAGDAIVKDLKLHNVIYYIMEVKNGFRGAIEQQGGKKKIGFSLPAKTTLKEFEKIFEEKVHAFKQIS